MENRRYHIIITGRVQGVGFRYFVDQNAKSLHLSGWVRNQMDGTVELEVQGESDRLEIFMRRLQEGPTFANIEAVDKEEVPFNKEERGFRIRMD